MSFFDFERKAEGNGKLWNYSAPDKPNYCTAINGLVVELSDPLKTKFNSQEIDRWNDSKIAKRNICVTILLETGQEVDWIFGPGSNANPSNALKACQAALMAVGVQGKGLEDMAGMHISIETQAPPQGFKYGQGAPRPWNVQILNAAHAPQWRGVKHIPDPLMEGGGQAQAAQQPQQPVQQMQPAQRAAVQAAQAAGFQQQQPQQPVQQMQPASFQQAQDMYAEQDIPF